MARAMAHYFSGSLASAIEDYQRADTLAVGELAHSRFDVAVDLGIAQLDRGSFFDARNSFEFALSGDYGHRQSALIHLGALEIDLGRYSTALEWLDIARSEVKPTGSHWAMFALNAMTGIAWQGRRGVQDDMEETVGSYLGSVHPSFLIDLSYGVIFVARQRLARGDASGAVDVLHQSLGSRAGLPAALAARQRSLLVLAHRTPARTDGSGRQPRRVLPAPPGGYPRACSPVSHLHRSAARASAGRRSTRARPHR
jgi:tetratricopeptide (TPR) repeat protein